MAQHGALETLKDLAEKNPGPTGRDQTCLCKKHLKIRYTRKSDVRFTLSAIFLHDK